MVESPDGVTLVSTVARMDETVGFKIVPPLALDPHQLRALRRVGVQVIDGAMTTGPHWDNEQIVSEVERLSPVPHTLTATHFQHEATETGSRAVALWCQQ